MRLRPVWPLSTVCHHMSSRIAKLLGLGLLSLSSLSGCAGLYVEGQVAAYPSLSYSADKATTSGAAVSGASHGLGLAAGVDFDMSRNHRFGLGYQSVSTSVGGGGKISGGASDARFDLKIISLTESLKLRLAMGFGFGSAESSGYKDKAGAPLANKTGANAGGFYGGPALSYYIGGHHELTAMVGPQYYFGSIPSGSVGGAGVVAKLTYTFHIINSWPEIFFSQSLGSNRNIMPVIARGAEAAGCSGRPYLNKDNTDATMLVECPGKGQVFFLQTSNSFGGFCQKMSNADCHEVIDRVLEKTLALLDAPVKPEAPEPPAAQPAPAAAPAAPPTTEPAPSAAPEAPATPAAPGATP